MRLEPARTVENGHRNSGNEAVGSLGGGAAVERASITPVTMEVVERPG
jgi:hypothetical protein